MSNGLPRRYRRCRSSTTLTRKSCSLGLADFKMERQWCSGQVEGVSLTRHLLWPTGRAFMTEFIKKVIEAVAKKTRACLDVWF